VLKTYQFKTRYKSDSHSSKTASINLPGLMIRYRCLPLCIQFECLCFSQPAV